MKEPRRLFVTMDRNSGLHSLVGVYPKSQLEAHGGVLDRDLLNDLIVWDSLESLSKSTILSGPLVPMDTHGGGDYRVMTIDDAIAIAEMAGGPRQKGRFGYCEGMTLYKEMYLDGGKPCFPSIDRVGKDIGRLGLLETDGISDLRMLEKTEPDSAVVVEPVGDWVFMRNICSILLRLIAHLKTEGADALSATGFEEIQVQKEWWHKRAPGRYHVIPLCHNPYVNMITALTPQWWKTSVFGVPPMPIYDLLCDGSNDGQGLFGVTLSVHDLTAPVVHDAPAPLLAKGDYFKGVDTRLYLALDEDGGEKEAAERFVEAAMAAFQTLRDELGRSLGWAFDSGDPTSEVQNVPKPVFCSLASAMVGTILYRYDSSPALCRGCGAGILVRQKGKKREFCSGRCKSRYSRKEGKR